MLIRPQYSFIIWVRFFYICKRILIQIFRLWFPCISPKHCCYLRPGDTLKRRKSRFRGLTEKSLKICPLNILTLFFRNCKPIHHIVWAFYMIRLIKIADVGKRCQQISCYAACYTYYINLNIIIEPTVMNLIRRIYYDLHFLLATKNIGGQTFCHSNIILSDRHSIFLIYCFLCQRYLRAKRNINGWPIVYRSFCCQSAIFCNMGYNLRPIGINNSVFKYEIVCYCLQCIPRISAGRCHKHTCNQHNR